MENVKLVHLNLSKDMVKKIDRLAKLEHESRTTVIRSALRDYLDERLLMIGDKE